jgi:hypothetical protein
MQEAPKVAHFGACNTGSNTAVPPAALLTVTLIVGLCPMFPAASKALEKIEWLPFDTVVVFQFTLYGEEASLPIKPPST